MAAGALLVACTAAPPPTPTVPPTATSVPTVLPTAVPTLILPVTRTPGLSRNAAAFVTYLGPRLSAAVTTLDRYRDLSAQASNQPALMDDLNWRVRLATNLSTLDRVGEEIRAYDGGIPPEVRELRDSSLDIGGWLQVIADETTRGIDESDPEHIANAAKYLTWTTQKLATARGQWQTLTDEAPPF